MIINGFFNSKIGYIFLPQKQVLIKAYLRVSFLDLKVKRIVAISTIGGSFGWLNDPV